jgi:uncharacterized protein YjiS (DUF1127 family)
MKTYASRATAFAVLLRRRETYHSLSILDDRTLRDIGLNRSMLMSVAIHGVRTPRREPMETIADAHNGRKPTMLTWVFSRVTEMRNRLAAAELRRFEADLGPNQLKECSGRAFGAASVH